VIYILLYPAHFGKWRDARFKTSNLETKISLKSRTPIAVYCSRLVDPFTVIEVTKISQRVKELDPNDTRLREPLAYFCDRMIDTYSTFGPE
jgi:hypothetical protein